MIIDSTTIQCFLQCPRKMFFNFRKHWRPSQPSIHLEFGIAWHLAKEHLLWNPNDLKGAMEKFLEHYRQFYPASMDSANAPKNPGGALDALATYSEKLKTTKRELLHTEVSGIAPLADDVDVAFKIDAIIRDDTGGIWCLDHKTGSRLTQAWTDGWVVSPQLCVYTHVLNHFYGQDKVRGAIVEGTIFRKNDHEHTTVQVRKTKESFGALFWSILHTVDLIKWNIAAEEAASPEDEILTAWPMRPNACFDYGSKCPYFDYCITWSNPLGRKCPSEFIVQEWNPLENVENSAKQLTMENA